MAMLKEFKEFALKGNIVDLAVGVVIGTAFGKIVDSLVKDIIMPPLGALLGNVDFSSKVVVLRQATAATPAVTLNYGAFLNSILSFVIIAFSIFFILRQLQRFRAKENAKPAASPAPTTEEKLLMEIRDLLKTK